jgi:hypothetical protein
MVMGGSMKTITIVASLLALVFLVSASPAHAQGPCRPDLVCAEDMAGLYISPESLMRVTIFPTGTVHVLWQNEYGYHEMTYRTTERLAGGGYIADADRRHARASTAGDEHRRQAGRAGHGPVVHHASPFLTDLRVYALAKIE